MGETQKQPFQLFFSASLKIDFQGSRVTSDGGLVLVPELDERLGFGELIEQHLMDSRHGRNTQLPFADLLRQSVDSRLPGCEDLNDAESLSQDPAFRLIGSERDRRLVLDQLAAAAGEDGRATDWIGFQATSRQGKERCRRNRSKERPFRTLAFSGAVNQSPSVGAGGSER